MKKNKILSKSKSIFQLKSMLIVIIGLVIIFFGWNTYQQSSQTPEINKITIGDTKGCYFREVKCVKEPCEPVLVAGKCISKTGACVTYADGCERATKCQQPVVSCGDTVKPEPSVGSSCICPPGAACKLPPSCNTPTPEPTPPPTSGTLYFVAKEPCGLNSFNNIVYDCTGTGSKSYSNGACTNIIQAMKAIQSLCAGGRKVE